MRVSRALKERVGAEHVDAFVLGDAVPQLHVHVVPRYSGARFGSVMAPFGSRRRAVTAGRPCSNPRQVSADRRSRYARLFIRLPHTAIVHQALERFFDAS